jgi:uncharacterized protein DUF6515
MTMNLATTASRRGIGIGLLALLTAVPLSYAQRQERGGEAPRMTESPRPVMQRQPAVVDRTNHGSIRHVDTHVVQRPVEAPRTVEAPRGGIDQRQHVISHHDVDADIGGQRFWHGFVFGARIHGLRPGYVQIYVGGIPFFYDDGIYYQQTGDDYQEVYPPVGADVQDLPDGAIEIDAGNIAYYYAGGAFYVQQGDGYVIAPTPIGVTVPELPPGAIEVSYNGGMAYQFNGIYYQPEFVDGVTQYVTFQP